MHTGTAQVSLPPAYHGAESNYNTNIRCAGVLYVQVDQQHVNPSGWPILLHPSACSRLAFVGSSDQAPLQTTAGDAVCVMVETQDYLQQRICQVSCIQSAVRNSISVALWSQQPVHFEDFGDPTTCAFGDLSDHGFHQPRHVLCRPSTSVCVAATLQDAVCLMLPDPMLATALLLSAELDCQAT